MNFTLSETGSYTFRVSARVTDSSGNSQTISKDVSFKSVGISNTSTISSSAINPGESVTINAMDKGKAAEMIRERVNELQGRIQGRMERNHKTGGDFIPFTYSEKLQELEDLQNNLSDTNCELFRVGVFVAVSAETKEDLDALTKYIQDKALHHQVVLDVLVGEQENGLNTILPCRRILPYPF